MHYFPTVVMWLHLWHHTMMCDIVMCNFVMWHFPILLPCIVSPKEKEKKRNINNNLAILPSHDISSTSSRVQVCYLFELVHSKMDLEHSLLVTFLVTQCQLILVASRGLNMSSRSIITCSMCSSYSITFWGYRKGSRVNSN